MRQHTSRAEFLSADSSSISPSAVSSGFCWLKPNYLCKHCISPQSADAATVGSTVSQTDISKPQRLNKELWFIAAREEKESGCVSFPFFFFFFQNKEACWRVQDLQNTEVPISATGGDVETETGRGEIPLADPKHTHTHTWESPWHYDKTTGIVSPLNFTFILLTNKQQL